MKPSRSRTCRTPICARPRAPPPPNATVMSMFPPPKSCDVRGRSSLPCYHNLPRLDHRACAVRIYETGGGFTRPQSPRTIPALCSPAVRGGALCSRAIHGPPMTAARTGGGFTRPQSPRTIPAPCSPAVRGGALCSRAIHGPPMTAARTGRCALNPLGRYPPLAPPPSAAGLCARGPSTGR